MTTKMTRQGVRDLNDRNRNAAHRHKYVPTNKRMLNGREVTVMECFCGDVYEESEDAIKEAKLADEDARIERIIEAAQYGWGVR